MKDFDSLVVEMTPVIHSIIRHLHIYKNQDDFFQIGLIALWKASEAFDLEKGSFMTYAYSYIRGMMMTELRKEARKENNEQFVDDYQFSLIIDESCLYGDDHLDLRDIIHELSVKEQRFLKLHFQDGLKLNEVASQLGVSYPTVKNWKKEVLGKLRKEINR